MSRHGHDHQTLFLAFAAGDAGAASGIAAELRRVPGVNLDYGVCGEPFDDQGAEIIRASLLRRLRHCCAALCLLGDHALNDDWVLWTLETAHQLKLPTLGAALSSTALSQAHVLLDLAGAEIVPLEVAAIVDRLPQLRLPRDVREESTTLSLLRFMKHPLR